MEQVFFNVPLSKLEPIFKRWMKEVNSEGIPTTGPSRTTEDLMNIEKAASFLNLSVATIYSKVSKGEIPFMKRSKRLYFSKEELTSYIKGGRQKTNAEIEEEANLYLKK